MKTPGRLTFNKNERLCSIKLIDSLFETGKHDKTPPFRLTWLRFRDVLPVPAQVVFIIPKKSFPKAADRNLLRRQMREIYRQNKHLLVRVCVRTGVQVALALQFNGKKQIPYRETERKIILLLQRLMETLSADDQ